MNPDMNRDTSADVNPDLAVDPVSDPASVPDPVPAPEPASEPASEPGVRRRVRGLAADRGVSAGPGESRASAVSASRTRGGRPVPPAATVVRVAGPEDLLAYIPYRLGFQPAESVVAVSLTGPRQRVGLVARVDLDDLRLRQPDDPSGPDGAATARWLTEHVVDDGADRAVVVLYTATDPTPPASRARRALELLRARLERRLPGVEAWVVTPTGFRALDCADPLCCPPRGRPLSVLKGSRVAAHMVLEGRTVAGTREERYALRPAPETARTQARRAAARWAETRRRLLAGTAPTGPARDGSARNGAVPSRPARDGTVPGGSARGGAVPGGSARGGAVPGGSAPGGAAPGGAARDHEALAAWGAESLRLWRSAVRVAAAARPGHDEPLSPVTLGKIGAALADTPVRDAVLLSLAPGTEETALRTARREADGGTDAATSAVMARIVDPEQGVPPDDAVTGPARRVLESVVAHVPRNRRAPAYLLLALVAWWHGDGGLAAERVTDTLAVDPEYRLALLLRSAIVGGVPPGWVRREQESFHAGGAARPGNDAEPGEVAVV